MKALPAPYHDHAQRIDRYLTARAEMERAALHGGAAYAEALARFEIALSHIGNEVEVSVTEKEAKAA